ncbi:MAG: sulfatase [Acidobacteria bacterium]|nr:MAG: sulfatase [Acidobacteriota bacterium]
MDREDLLLQLETRRHFFSRCGVGLGKLALLSLLSDGSVFAEPAASNPSQAKPGHFPAKAKSVIYLFMAGGPSQFELFDFKPSLQKYNNQAVPDSLMAGKRFAFMDSFTKDKPKLLGTSRNFKRYGRSGAWVSDLLPHIAGISDDITFLKGVSTENFNHGPAKCFVNTGSTRFGRPAMGSWITYGIGSDSSDLPGFVVLQSGPRGPRGGAALWASGFLPTAYQGVPFRSGGDPILDLSRPSGISAEAQHETIRAIRDLNLSAMAESGDPEIATRVASYEMAYRMQTSGPELIDFGKESKETLESYGAEPGMASYANNCLLARRLVERGVRFVQLYHTDWDHHADLGQPLDQVTREVDQPTAALIRDLKQRGLLDHTLVVWGGEFGRTPMGEIRDTGKAGRNHHIDAFTLWMAGGGVKPGQTIGDTDEFGFSPAGDSSDIHDLHATMLRLLGLDHTRLIFKFQGRDFRLTDVSGRVIEKLIA